MFKHLFKNSSAYLKLNKLLSAIVGFTKLKKTGKSII